MQTMEWADHRHYIVFDDGPALFEEKVGGFQDPTLYPTEAEKWRTQSRFHQKVCPGEKGQL